MTRQDYVTGKVTHEEYYRSIAKTAGVDWSKHEMIPYIRKLLREGDAHLNRIGLAWWDSQGRNAVLRANLAPAFKLHDDFITDAGVVCALKQAARDAALNERKEENDRD